MCDKLLVLKLSSSRIINKHFEFMYLVGFFKNSFPSSVVHYFFIVISSCCHVACAFYSHFYVLFTMY